MDDTQVAALVQQTRELYTQLRTAMQQRWQRDLPLEELLFDRWERARNLGFGEGASIYHNSYVYGKVQVGERTWIGPFTLLDGTGGLTIGKNCSISTGVQIYTHDTVKWAVSGGVAKYEHAPVNIADHCFIGANAVILKGVNIGPHAVVGASALVTRSVPPLTIVAGTPARPIGRVEINDNGEVQLLYAADLAATALEQPAATAL